MGFSLLNSAAINAAAGANVSKAASSVFAAASFVASGTRVAFTAAPIIATAAATAFGTYVHSSAAAAGAAEAHLYARVSKTSAVRAAFGGSAIFSAFTIRDISASSSIFATATFTPIVANELGLASFSGVSNLTAIPTRVQRAKVSRPSASGEFTAYSDITRYTSTHFDAPAHFRAEPGVNGVYYSYATFDGALTLSLDESLSVNTKVKDVNALFGGNAYLGLTPVTVIRASGSASVSADFTAEAVVTIDADAYFSSAGYFDPVAVRVLPSSASFSGDGRFFSSCNVGRAAASVFQGAASFSSLSTRQVFGGAGFVGTLSFDCISERGLWASVPEVVGTAEFTADPTVWLYLRGESAFAGSAELVADAYLATTYSLSTLTGMASFTADAYSFTHLAFADFSASASFDAAGYQFSHEAESLFLGSATVIADGYSFRHEVLSPIIATASLLLDGTVTQFAEAITIANRAFFTADGYVGRRQATAAIRGAAALTVDAYSFTHSAFSSVSAHCALLADVSYVHQVVSSATGVGWCHFDATHVHMASSDYSSKATASFQGIARQVRHEAGAVCQANASITAVSYSKTHYCFASGYSSGLFSASGYSFTHLAAASVDSNAVVGAFASVFILREASASIHASCIIYADSFTNIESYDSEERTFIRPAYTSIFVRPEQEFVFERVA